MKFLLIIYRIKYVFPELKKILKLVFSKNRLSYKAFCSMSKSNELIITNNLGGGTYRFFSNMIKQKEYIILKNISYGKIDFAFILQDSRSKQFCFFNIRILSGFLQDKQIKTIIINNFVSNNKIFFIQEELIKNNHLHYIFLVHDYYLICPCYMLYSMNTFCDFKYCNSKKCLNNFSNNYNYWWKPRINSIAQWRTKWKSFLSIMTEIRCFSSSSKEFVEKIYPESSKIITVKPHSLDYCNINSIKLNELTSPKIGIIGSFTSNQKGKAIITKLLKEQSKYATNMSFTIIGCYKKIVKKKSDNIKYIGAYSSCEELEDIIIKNNINVLFFPSVWPETFSYLVSELIMTGLPIVSFNYGAQAEKIKKYRKGVICSNITTKSIMISLNKAFMLNFEKEEK